MNNEIKEILEKPNVYSFNDECYLYFGDYNKLKDYITNLKTSLDESQEVVIDLQQENERLKETNVYCNRTDCVGRIKDSKKYDSVYQEKEDYKSRIEKTIEYIEKVKSINKEMQEDDMYWEYNVFFPNLLNILNGRSDE